MTNNIYKGTITKPRNTLIDIGNIKYKLKRQIDFRYAQKKDNNSEFIIESPLNLNKSIRTSPATEMPQIFRSVENALLGTAKRYHTLSNLGKKTLEEQEEFDRLDWFLQQAT